MPAMSGIELTRRIKSDHPEVVVVLISAEEPSQLPAAAGTCGAATTIRKEDLGPARLAELWQTHGANGPGPPD